MEQVAYSQGLEGVIAGESKICKVNGEQGKLYYYGYSINDLANKASFEEVTYLLLYGELPKKKQLTEFSALMRAGREIKPPIVQMIRDFPPGFSSHGAFASRH